MFGGATGEQFLTQLFVDQYGDCGPQRLHEFLRRLSGVELPFSVLEQMRKQEFPGFPGFECGLPPSYYYFVPGTCYGGHQSHPADPLDPSFVATVDGAGLNFGCPIRLEMALYILFSLSASDQQEPRVGLKAATKHLATVEELLWAGAWKSPLSIGRRTSQECGRSHDWRLQFEDVTLNVEAKFVPANWVSIVDGDDFQLMRGALAKKASAQLPSMRTGHINVVVVTGIAPVGNELRMLVADDLTTYPNVQAIVYGDIVGQATVFSLSKEFAHQVHKRLQSWPADRFRGFSTVTTQRPENARRAKARARIPSRWIATTPSTLVEIGLENLAPKKTYLAPPQDYPYRFELKERLSTGEPIFTWIPPFLTPAPGISALPPP